VTARLVVVVVALSVAIACGPPPNPAPACEGKACTVDEDGDLVTVVDATDREGWVPFDLDTATIVDDDSWDIEFQRYKVAGNGGASGDGGVRVAVLDDTDYDDVERAPADGYREDEEGADARGDPLTVFLGDSPWYDYDLLNHTLSAKEGRVYVVQTTRAQYAKLAFEAYYDEDGEAGHMTFRWSLMGAP
jgi:hypothetical protein